MTNSIIYRINSASETQIYQHLYLCDANFIPMLSERLDIADYANKIVERAQRFEAWSENALIGLVAAYCNNFQDRTAYITSVSVVQNWQGEGIASELVNRSIAYIKKQKFERIELEVHRENKQALNLYLKKRFKCKQVDEQTVRMTLNFDNNS